MTRSDPWRCQCLALLLLLASCSSGPKLVVVNRSAATLDDVVVSGVGFERPIGALKGSEQRTLEVHPRGESGVRLRFKAAGRTIDSGELGYIENNPSYRVVASVEPSLEVKVESSLGNY
ncbi:hypothetical protein [Cyanobium sp. Morenito 9A2]|uniref:hypothetical protein n=1 Tax=Cyanobium sp. Morenito 9A2 TaxID=2823718 RepID=UPI0020CEB143|nr:hypothetical protein [Cyanobium sp. Morenito 9A2]MCP9849815.1 hypothetical protein [Cyanobium sp. Morenito 9A2]